MERQEILKRMAKLVFFVFILNFIAGKLNWYISIWYFDMPMHFLGGVFLGFLAFYCAKYFNFDIFNSTFKKQLLYIFFFTLVVGIGWEIYEIMINNLIAQNPFNTLDTISDLCFDVSGGMMATFFFLKKNLL